MQKNAYRMLIKGDLKELLACFQTSLTPLETMRCSVHVINQFFKVLVKKFIVHSGYYDKSNFYFCTDNRCAHFIMHNNTN